MKKDPCCFRIDQLANLGLPSQVFIPALLQELHFQIPALSNTFCWIDDQGKLCNIFDESHNTQVIDEFVSSIKPSTDDSRANTVSWISKISEIVSTRDMFDKCPHLSNFYNSVLIPLGYLNSCFVPIQSKGKNIGILMIHRQNSDDDFSEIERTHLSNIATTIVKGMIRKPRKSIKQVDGWEQGLIIVDLEGKLLHACDMGMKLLMLSQTNRFNSSTNSDPSVGLIFEDLPKLIKSLTNSRGHQTSLPNPVLTTSNDWGCFSIRGFLINDYSDDGEKQIGLTISKQEPYILRIFHRIKRLDLTPRQETIGLFYAAGFHHQEIAETLSLSLFTVKEHVRNLCEALRIQSRSELIELILCDIRPEKLATTATK